MLIRGGLIHTMTGQEAFIGDILVHNGRIERVDEHIDAPEEACILDASGMTILPGLIDAHIHDGPEVDAHTLIDAQASGVTGGLLWPEEEGECRLLRSDEMRGSGIFALQPQRYTDVQLHDRFLALAQDGMRVACEIRDAQACQRILQVVHSTRVKPILLQLCGCEDMLEAVALSGCPVIIGVSSSHAGSSWTMASRLQSLGTQVALSCSYPHAKLRHLPLCAALCVRDGMDRERAMRSVTEVPAAILRLSDVGRIAHGCQADLAIYDGDPLLLATSHVMTIAGGKIRH